MLLAKGAKGKKIAVLGDMLELGPNADQMHEEVGRFLAGQGVDLLVACGVLGRGLAKGAKQAGLDPSHILEAPDAPTAAAAVKTVVKRGDAVLIKASRGMKLELVADALRGATRTTTKAS